MKCRGWLAVGLILSVFCCWRWAKGPATGAVSLSPIVSIATSRTVLDCLPRGVGYTSSGVSSNVPLLLDQKGSLVDFQGEGVLGPVEMQLKVQLDRGVDVKGVVRQMELSLSQIAVTRVVGSSIQFETSHTEGVIHFAMKHGGANPVDTDGVGRMGGITQDAAATMEVSIVESRLHDRLKLA